MRLQDNSALRFVLSLGSLRHVAALAGLRSLFATKPARANTAQHRVHGFASRAERAVQIFAILTAAVFLLSGVIYLYLGRVTSLATGNLWSVYTFALRHTWLEGALVKQAGHVTFFPSLIFLTNFRFFHGDAQTLFFAGIALLFVTVSLLLIPVWRDKTVSLTAKTLSTLVVILGNLWMGRASITANGEFNCDTSLVMGAAAFAFFLIPKTRCSWAISSIVVFAGFVASFSFGTGLAIWPTLLVLAWCLRLPRRTIVLLGISAVAAAAIYEILPVLPSTLPDFAEISGTPAGALSKFFRLVGSPVLYTIAAWRGEKTLTNLEQSFSIASWSGLVGLALAGIAVMRRVLRRDLGESSLESTALSLLIFNLFALTLIAIGRLKSFDLAPFAPRYLYWSSLFWTSLILLGIARTEHLERGQWSALLLPFAIAILAWPAHYQAWFWCKNAQFTYDNDAIALINGAVETQMVERLGPQFKQIFQERLHQAPQLKARRLDVFADGLQDWIGPREADVFGARHEPEGLSGRCSIDALARCDDGAPAARVSGQAFKHKQSIPRTLIIADSNGVIHGVARSARISPFVNRMFYQGKFTANIGFVGYIRHYDPELQYMVRSADNLTVSDEAIPVQHQSP